MHHSLILAQCSEDSACALGALVAATIAGDEIHLLSGPTVGLVMLQVRESVERARFNASEILVTEVRLELRGQFGFGMVIGNAPRRALAHALVDAALALDDDLAISLQTRLDALNQETTRNQQEFYRAIATTRVAFDVF